MTFSSKFCLTVLQASPVEGHSLQIKKTKGGKGMAKIIEKLKDFCACPSQNGVKRNASGKEGKLSCCRCLFDYIKANLAISSLKISIMPI